MIVKALSLRQPWGRIVVDGEKRIENRKWKTKLSLPLPFLIHAASTMTVADHSFAQIWCGTPLPDRHSKVYLKGGIIGAAVITHIYPPGSTEGGIWHMREQHGYKLEQVIPLPFRPLKGALGFFDVELTSEEEALFRPLLPQQIVLPPDPNHDPEQLPWTY